MRLKIAFLKINCRKEEFFRQKKAATALEYGLIAALLATSAIAVLIVAGHNLSTTFNTLGWYAGVDVISKTDASNLAAYQAAMARGLSGANSALAALNSARANGSLNASLADQAALGIYQQKMAYDNSVGNTAAAAQDQSMINSITSAQANNTTTSSAYKY